MCRLTLMHLMEMNHWPWTWAVWAKVKFGSMAKALEDTGLHTLLEIVTNAAMLELSALQSVKLAVASHLSDGNLSLLLRRNHYNIISTFLILNLTIEINILLQVPCAQVLAKTYPKSIGSFRRTWRRSYKNFSREKISDLSLCRCNWIPPQH